MIFEPMVRLAQTVHLSCVKICTISKQTETSIHLSLDTYHHCVENDFQAYGTFGANLHLSCTDTNTVSKQTEMRFHMAHVT